MRTNILSVWMSVVSVCAVAACGSPDASENNSEELAKDAVGVAAQPLGGWRLVYEAAQDEAVEHIGPKYSIVSRLVPAPGVSGVADVPEIVVNDTGAKLAVTPLPAEMRARVSDAVSDARNVVFVDRGNNRIYAYRPATPTSGRWALIGAGVQLGTWGVAALSDTNVYVDTRAGIVSARLNADLPLRPDVPAQGVTAVPNSTNWRLLGAEPSQYLHVSERASVAPYPMRLLRITTSGSPWNTIANPVYSVSDTMTTDATHYWFVDSDVSGTERRIQKVKRSNSERTTVKHSKDVGYGSVASNGAALYWWEFHSTTFQASIRRMNLSNGNHVTRDALSDYGFVVAPASIFARGPDWDSIYRGDL